MSAGPASGSLWSPAFRNVFAAQVVSIFGDGLVPVALAIAVLEETGSPTSLGLVMTARATAMVLFVLAGGVWADRLPRRSLMAGADVVRAGTQIATGVLLLGSSPVAALAALQFAHGAATAVANPATSGLVAEIVPVRSLQRGNGVLVTVASIGSVAGPAAAGVIVVVAGAAYALIADGLTFLVSAALLMRVPAGPRRTGERAFVGELREGWRELTARTWLWVSVLDAAAFQLLAGAAFFVIAPAVVIDGHGDGAWALLVALLGAGAVAGGAATMLRPARRPLLVGYALSLAYAAFLAIVALEAPLPVAAAGAFAGGFGLSYAETLYEAAVQEHVPGRVLSRVSAWDWLGSTLPAPVGLALIGPVAAATSAPATLAGAAVLTAAATCAALLVPDVRGLTHDKSV
jgi:MFS family permease